MPTSYSDLLLYRHCPRKFGFIKLGYAPPTINEPLQTGSFVHAGLTAHFKGQDAQVAIFEASLQVRVPESYPATHPSEFRTMQMELDASMKRAKELTARYILNWAKDYKAVLVEPTLEIGGVVCHPDLIAFYGTPKEQRVIVDYKTSYHPDNRWYDISNQTDLYAYIYRQKTSHRFTQLVDKRPVFCKEEPETISLIIYDIISEEGIYRHTRPPRLAAGERLFNAVKLLDDVVRASDAGMEKFLVNPHPDYTCPSRCDFFTPCWLLDTDSWDACKDFLEENFLYN